MQEQHKKIAQVLNKAKKFLGEPDGTYDMLGFVSRGILRVLKKEDGFSEDDFWKVVDSQGRGK